MRIWWQSSTPLDSPKMSDYRAHLVAHVNDVKRPETEVHFSGVDSGSLALDYDAVVELNSMAPGGVLHKAIQAEAEGYDVFAIGCMLDPGLLQARELVKIPVVSLGETTLLISCMLGHKVSGVAFSDKQALRYTRQAYAMGLRDRVEPFESLGIDFPTLAASFDKPDAMVESFRRAAERLITRGVEVVIPACATLDLFLAEAGMNEVDGARVLHADATLVKIAETFGDLAPLGVQVSRRLLNAGPADGRREEILSVYGIQPRASAPIG